MNREKDIRKQNWIGAILLMLIGGFPNGYLQAQTDSCLQANSNAITSLTSDDFTDLQFLKPLVANKQIVLLGESSHGIGEFYSLKSRLVKFLYQECGFEVLAMESGLGDIYFELKNLDKRSAVELRNGTVYNNFQCQEILPLFELIKSSQSNSKPLTFVGIDSQNFGTSMDKIKEIVRKYLPNNKDSLINELNKYYRIPSMLWIEDKTPLFQLAYSIKMATNRVHKILTDNKKDILTSFNYSNSDFDMLVRVIENHQEAMKLDWRTDNPSSKRDSLMAENLFWLMRNMIPNKKIILWAHNGHIDKSPSIGNPYKWLGNYVKEYFMEASYQIGLFAQKGETYEWWTKSSKSFDNSGLGQVENHYSFSKISFNQLQKGLQSCPKSHERMKGFELENGGNIDFVPILRFDGLITIQNAHIPTYK